jgi:isoleucyl-tRNA synthetase
METIWWVFKQLWNKGRIYKSHRIMPYSWKLTTPLSNFEANRNYQDVQDPAITLRFRLKESLHAGLPSYALAWTTTPWTLPGNLALAVGPDITYLALQDLKDNVVYLMAKERVAAYYKDAKDYQVVGEFTGSQLVNRGYEPLFPYFPDHAGAFRILADGFVSTGDGTGIVHCAPAFGEDDFKLCKREGIALVDYLEFCKDADKAIIRRLKDEGKLVHQSTMVHSYPFCGAPTPRSSTAPSRLVRARRGAARAHERPQRHHPLGARSRRRQAIWQLARRRQATGTSAATASGAPASPSGR